uniref:Uncharacterized protein n=1 Tax=Anguilla anguilla TaxID=7936 RepID=A0A0E9V0C9_ANGAN
MMMRFLFRSRFEGFIC